MTRASFCICALTLAWSCASTPVKLDGSLITDADGGTEQPDGGPTTEMDAGIDTLPAGACMLCPQWGGIVDAGALGDTQLIELSGLVASRTQPGVFFANNDSGDSARLFVMSANGAPLGRYTITGASAVDWEDLSIGPCAQGSCLYIADIGDNMRTRSSYTVYRLPEPTVPSQLGFTLSVSAEALPFVYPDEAHNAEALVVHPVTGMIYVITKQALGVASRVYRFPMPLTPGVTATLEYVATLKVPTSGDIQLTGAAFHPCGGALLLRLYNRVVELRIAPGDPWEKIFTQPAITVPSITEPQGEAVTYSSDGNSFYTASENAGQNLNRTVCQ
ncbi:MAG: hypothetical protein K1X64_13580 [Myxococcaceae bacterium]|nr:hypothetical protein [Myxococcaceae bacterium]